ncbi:TPA: hypothetical protein OXC52_004179 [Enterobacter asburiae]|nr:hypothetical protein [Enterobacter asburiae]HCW3091058.1 hypothetical protein [Enterobacter asburiae]HCW3146681.1 hypothetical protein [Enterobacter asburiae]HCW3430933.1 hypothetical protein [Enterobacter asburiae]
MKNIKYWHVKLYQHTQNAGLIMGAAAAERLLHEGYSKGEVSLPPRDGRIKLLTEPCGIEVKTVRADVVDSIVCTPVYEGETGLNPPRDEMLEYIKTAIGEGYHPEHVAAVLDLSVIDGLNDDNLNREFGKCWQWYNLGGGIHETFAPQDEAKADSDDGKGRYNYDTFKAAAKPLIQWLNENANPHASVIVDCTSAELLTGEIAVNTKEFLKD